MLDTFLYAFEAVAPLIILILLGMWFKKIRLFSDEFVSKGYSFSFRVALPCLLFCNVYSIDSIESIDFRTVLYATLITVVSFIIASVIAVLMIKDKRQRGVIVQCFFRSNCAIIGLSLTESLAGVSGLASVSVITAFTIPLYNILAVIALSIFNTDVEEDKDHGINWKKIFINIAKNPLIIGVCLGLLCLAVRGFIPENADGEKVFLLSRELKVIYSSVKNVGNIASPFMIMILGAKFTFSAVSKLKYQITIGVIGRIIFTPCLAIGLGYLLSLTGLLDLGPAEYAAFIAVFATPVAVSTAIMAREMNNDDILAGQLVVWTSVFSVLTIFLFVVVLRTLGLL